MAMGSPSKMGNTALADINVTPLVDVMLVLLIIFMVTAPLLQQGVKVKLPEATGETLKADKENPKITVLKDGRFYLDKYEIPREELLAKLSNNERLQRSKQVTVYGDQGAPYGYIAEALAALHAAGLEQAGLVFENVKVKMTAEGPEVERADLLPAEAKDEKKDKPK
jgi:biopolymer transport protein TolR